MVNARLVSNKNAMTSPSPKLRYSYVRVYYEPALKTKLHVFLLCIRNKFKYIQEIRSFCALFERINRFENFTTIYIKPIRYDETRKHIIFSMPLNVFYRLETRSKIHISLKIFSSNLLCEKT